MTLHDAILTAAPVLAIMALVFGPLAAWSAARRQRNPAVWLLFGALLGPVAVAVIRAAPPARCPNCSEPSVGFERRCATCGIYLRSPGRRASAAVAPAAGPGEAPPLRAVPEPPPATGAERRRFAMRSDEASNDARPDRLSAVGARRPDPGATVGAGGTRPDVTLLAMGVLVRGTDTLLPGSRYLIARTRDRLLIIGPIEASHEHVKLDLPLAGVEANAVGDRLVITGMSDDSPRRSFLLGFQSVASMTGRPVDQAIMELAPPISIAAGHQ